MISRLSGQLAACEPTEAVVDVGGVGYAVTIPMSTYDLLPRVGGDVVLHTHLNVREDALQLYGFATLDERRLFVLLMTVNGVGPRLALSALSCLPVDGLCRAIAAGDVKALSRISGVGKRTAERLVLELREKVLAIQPAAAVAGSARLVANREVQDAINALETLGFKGDAAHKTIARLQAELPAAEQSAENL
ncbi:MAG: Holliday junction branch migration protein RuvA, partial [bacterium]